MSATIQKITNNSKNNVLFRNLETKLNIGYKSDRDDVFLGPNTSHTYSKNLPHVPKASGKNHFDYGRHMVIEVGSVVNYIWDHSWSVRMSQTGWEKPTDQNKIPGDADIKKEKELIIAADGKISLKNP